MTMRLFVFGAGYSGRAIARAVIAEGGTAAGTTRSPEKAAELQAAGIEPFVFGGMAIGNSLAEALHSPTHLVVSIAPDHGMRGEGEPGREMEAAGSADPLLNLSRDLIATQMPALRWVGYLSTVGVYGDHGGAWLDEVAPCMPVSRRSRLRLRADLEWLALSQETSIPVAVLRLAGIYGPGRNAFVNLENGTARRIVKADQVFNRIHVDDIAGAALHLGWKEAGGIFNVADGTPAPPQDVVAYAAALMGVAPPPEIAFGDAQMTPMARSFYGENKRISNRKLVEAGYRFRFSDYREALDDLWKTDTWRGRSGGTDARSKIRP